MPEEVTLIRAAKILNCKPWELVDVDKRWIDWAFISENAEALVKIEVNKHPKRYK